MHGASNNEAALKEYLSKRIIKTKKIYPEEFQEVIKTYGKVLPSPDQTLSIVAGSNGTVSFNKNLLSAGFFSNKNAQLFSIKAKGIENNPVIKIQSAQEEYNKQKSKYDRALKLVGDKIMSRSEFENIEADYRIAKATLEAYKKEYSSNKEIIRAPVSGTIDKILVNPGDYVEAGQILAEIRTNNRVQIKAELNTNSIESISAIESALIKTSNGDLYKTSDYNGVRTNTGNIALENNFLPVYFTMDQPDRLIIGDFLEVFLYGKKKENTIMIPNSSIMEEQGQYYVFIRHGVTDFHKTYITKGISDAEHTEVLTGIKAGDIIVSEGTVIVKLATQTSNMPASTHSH
jgi:RND family efflux transporter MFP subunit